MKLKTFLILLLSGSQIIISAQGHWTHSNLSLARGQMEAAKNGPNIYFAGGQANNGWTSMVDIYNITTGEWTTSNLSTGRSFPAAASVGSKVIFAGGMNPSPVGIVDIYDTGTKLWTTASLNKPRFSLGTSVYGDHAIFAGGADIISSKAFKNVDIYNTRTNTWTIDSLSVARAAMGTAMVGSRVYFAGGYMFEGRCSDRIDIYDFNTGKWETATLPSARGFLAATAVGKKIIFAGGMTAGGTPTDRVDILDTETGTWTVSKLSIARAFFSNGATVYGKAFFAGGHIVDLSTNFIEGYFDVVDIYDPVTGLWSVEKLSHKLNSNVVTGYENKLYSAGGFSENGPLITVDIYNASSGTWTQNQLLQYKDHMARAVAGSKVYFAGGYALNSMFTGQYSTDMVEIYDTKTGTWTYDRLSIGRDWLEGISCGSKVIFAGGWDDDGELQTRVDIYDTLSHQWSIADLSVARRMLTPAASGDIVMFAGGQTADGKSSSVIDVYNVKTGEWSTDQLSLPRLGVSSAAHGDLLFFAGGLTYEGQTGSEIVRQVVDIYNVKTGTWTTANLSQPRIFIASAVAGDKVIFAGGQDGTEPSKVVDIYDTTTGMWTTDLLSVARAFDDNDQNSAVACDKAYFVGGMFRNATQFLEDFNTIDIYDPATNTWTTDYLPYGVFGHSVAGVDDKLLVAGGISILPEGFDIHNELLIYTCTTSGNQDITDSNDSWRISIVPNPAGDLLKVSLADGDGYETGALTMYDICGKVVMIHNNHISGVAVDVSQLHAGIYLLEWSHKGQLFRNKLVIAR